MVFERPRGVRDIAPREMMSRKYAQSVISSIFDSYGYMELQTPTFEFLDLFKAKSGSEITDHLYVFEDKGGRSLCLRPEATASVARMYCSDLRTHQKPLRLYYVCPMFRYEEPQKGRYREFWQAGVELIGSSGPSADAEVIIQASDCLRKLGLRCRIRVSHIGVVRHLLKSRGFNAESQDKLIQLLDKGDMKAVREMISDEKIVGLFNVKGSSDVVEDVKKLLADDELTPLIEEFQKTLSLLDAAGVEYTVDFSMARGLDYYTGIIFDVKVDELGAQNQVAGGGRYDDLISLFGGPNTPAVGYAFGLDRIVEAVGVQGIGVLADAVDAMVIPLGENMRGKAFEVAHSLRAELGGRRVVLDISERKLNKALQYAAESGVRYAVIVGEKEAATGSVMLKDMSSKTQDEVLISELSKRII